MRWLVLLAFAVLAACDVATTASPGAARPQSSAPQLTEQEARSRAGIAARQFVSVVETVEPVAERECRMMAPRANCDFQIVVDDRPGQPPNAFQTVDRNGRPILAFNLGLIASVENADELAFVMGHEAAHHVLGHLGRTQQNAAVGAVILSGLVALGGADAAAVQSAEQIGASLGARTYSKDFELEADRLGTIITARAGYNPVRGAQFFNRIPDPGNRFLGSHPPNAARMEMVRRTAEGL
ncbi:M48 family metallopeptidase [Marivita geojedonensis]|uniref:Peptidase M48 n=1 Tax=Marivita geojedonensis TaxID=1123756 RepID=A0A1X4NDJ6_9RHOB|nr:M48 family metallopeptidase [Marivita geojedonensis]OSQ44947.1 peptidase M48 [Marivita geojedonensis]PRY73835.1 peptidase M48-like protein [Marivita geojedonensis]